MLNKANKQVKVGDLFVELDITKSTWEVVGILEMPPLPTHVRIKKLGRQEVRLTSVSALLDKAFYKRTDERPLAVPAMQPELKRDRGDRISSLFGNANQ
jgi:hypothetical protein